MKLFKFRPFDEFEVWLNALAAHHRHAGAGFASTSPVNIDRDFLEDLRTSSYVIEELLALAQAITEAEARETAPELSSDLTERDLKAQVRGYRRYARRIGDFVQFWEFLESYGALATGLLRLPNLSRREFKAFGSILLSEALRFRKGQSHAYLKRKTTNYSFSFIIQRDVTAELEGEGTRAQLENLFQRFFDLLRVFRYVDGEMRKGFKYRKILVLFLCAFQLSRKLLRQLEEAGTYLELNEPELAEKVNGVKLILKMEIRRVFQSRLKDIDEKRRVDLIYGDMQDTLGVLHNSVRESMTHLIHGLNPEFDEFQIFEDLLQRHQATVILLDDLKRLQRISMDEATLQSEEGWKNLHRSVLEFQETSMRDLFFKDWVYMEGFGDELGTATEAERAMVLHRLQIFLTTLMDEVSKRTILTKYNSRHIQQAVWIGTHS